MAKADNLKCAEILKDREAKYGSFVEQLPNYCQFIDAIKVVKRVNFHNPKVSRQVKGANQLKYLLALKATRHLVDPTDDDHVNDFINYLLLSQELEQAELYLDPRVFNPQFALDFTIMARSELVQIINESGMFAQGVESKVKLKRPLEDDDEAYSQQSANIAEDMQGSFV